MFERLETELNETIITNALAQTDARDAFVAGCGTMLDFMVRPDVDSRWSTPRGPRVERLHAIDYSTGLLSLQMGLHALEKAGCLRVPNTPAVAVAMFGALTEAGIVLSRGGEGVPTCDELLDAVVSLVRQAVAAP